MAAVILIGPPGAGKTSVAKALAKVMNISYSDTDHLIELESGKKISQIFLEDGEAEFRALESVTVKEAMDTESGILALGGGAILDPATQQLLRQSPAWKIFLDVSISQAAPRVGFNKDRPLLLINPRQQWLALMEKRRPIYESLADLTVITDNKKANEVASEISAALDAKK